MNQSLPFLPGYTFPDLTKTRFGYPQTLVYSKGVPLSHGISTSTTKKAVESLSSQNQMLDKEKTAELTYGPKKPATREVHVPRFVAMDKKVLRFDGYFREEIDDWAREPYRIRPVKVFYYLLDDTMEVNEPKIPNSGLLQGTLFKRQSFPHPKGDRKYLWKDLNMGKDLVLYGINIHLTDCDQWTREYLTNAGLELNTPEATPPDPYQLQKSGTEPRNETRTHQDDRSYRYLTGDKKILRFFGAWQDVLSDPPELRRVVLQFYMEDGTMELLEDHAPNCGRLPFKVLVKRQKIPLDRNELPDSFPATYMEIQDEDLRWFSPRDLRTGRDIVVLGKKIFLYDCDDATREFYRAHLGVDRMERISVAHKPKPAHARVVPPHTGIGGWEDSLQNCLNLIPKAPKKDFKKQMMFDGVSLRYKAELITPIADDRGREFVVTFYPADDTVAIHKEFVPNSGFPGGAFMKRGPLHKPQEGPGGRPVPYGAADLYVGAELKSCGKLFVITDADRFVLTFMEEHPEMYSHEKISSLRKKMLQKEPDEAEIKERETLIQMMREDVLKKFGSCPYPLPRGLEPAVDLQLKEQAAEELYSANMPISQELLNKTVEICTDENNRTDMNEVRKILLPVLGHNLSN